MYEKQEWKARDGTGLKRFIKTHETADEVYLTNEPLSITEPGTPFSAERMNHIEDGIEAAHEEIAAEANARDKTGTLLNERIDGVDEALNERIDGVENTTNSIANEIDNTNSELSDLQRDFNAWIGRGGYLNAFDFGVAEPTQEALTAQALVEITSITDPSQIWNGTKIVNLINNSLWILTNTQDTDPPVFEWTNQGNEEIGTFANGIGGIIFGADPVSDPPEYIHALSNGKGKVDLARIKDQFIQAIIMPGIIEPTFISDEAVLAQFRRLPCDGRTIPVTDPRVARLLQYCLIPYAAANNNANIIGMYLTNDNYPTHAAWLNANKIRPTPASNGAYLAIPDGSGLFVRGAGQHGGHKAADNTSYDGGVLGEYQTDKNKFHTHGFSNNVPFDGQSTTTGTGRIRVTGSSYTNIYSGSSPVEQSGDKEAKPTSLSASYCITF